MKSSRKFFFLATACVGVALFGGCRNLHEDVMGESLSSQVKIRNIQSREYETTDKRAVMHAVLATMQDLGFVIEQADERLGTVTGTSYLDGVIKLSVSVRQKQDFSAKDEQSKAPARVIVRANARALDGWNRMQTLLEPRAYQNFFNALSQTLFLEEHAVE